MNRSLETEVYQDENRLKKKIVLLKKTLSIYCSIYLNEIIKLLITLFYMLHIIDTKMSSNNINSLPFLFFSSWYINYILLFLWDGKITKISPTSKNQTGIFIYFIIPCYDINKNEQFNWCFWLLFLNKMKTVQTPMLKIPILQRSQNKKHWVTSATSERKSHLHLLSTHLLLSTGHIIVHNFCAQIN